MLETGTYHGSAEGLDFNFRIERNAGGKIGTASGDIFQGKLFLASFVCSEPEELDGCRVLTGKIIFRGNPELFSGSVRLEADERNIGSFQLSVDLEGDHRDIFAGRLEWDGSFLRRMIIEVDGIEFCQPPNKYVTQDKNEMSIEEAFRRAGFDAQVHVDPFEGRGLAENQMRGYTLAEIHAAMERLRSETYADRFHVHVFVCSYLAGRNNRGVLGIMYDFDENDMNHVPREGIAIFYDHPLISDPRIPEMIRNREYVFTAVHEVGHALNLLHSFDKARPSALSWMNYPNLYPRGYEAGAGYDGTSEFWRQFEEKFDKEELKHLHHATPRELLPGGFPFGVYEEGLSYPFGGSVEPRRTRLGSNPLRVMLGIELTLEPLKPEYELGEPIFLKIGVRNRTSGSVYVPNALDPMDGYLRIIMHKPNGEIAQFKPPVRLCKQAQLFHLPAGREFPHSFTTPLFLSARGPEFTSPGTYKISAELKGINGSRIIYSDACTIRIVTPDRSTEKFVEEFWNKKGALRALYLRHPLVALEQWNEIDELMKKSPLARRPSNTTWSYFNYIAALGWLTEFAETRERKIKEISKDNAIRHLNEVNPKGLPDSVNVRLEGFAKLERDASSKQDNLTKQIYIRAKDKGRAEIPPSGLFGHIGLDKQKRERESRFNPFARILLTLKGQRRFADIVSWNIEHLDWTSRWNDIPEIAELIRSFSCDFWGLQEVNETSLKELTSTINTDGMSRYEYKVMPGKGQQCGALFRSDTTSVQMLKIPDGFFKGTLDVEITDGKTKTKDVFLRTPLLADVRIINGQEKAFDFRCAVVHLKSTDTSIKDKGNGLREQAVKELIRWIEYDRTQTTEKDYLILGDMNAETALNGLKDFTTQENLKLLSIGMKDKYGMAEAITRVASKRLLDHIVITDEALPYMPKADENEQIIIRSDKTIPEWTNSFSDHVPVAVRFIIGVDKD